MLCDSDGFAIPFADAAAVIECGATDPDYGEPESWPPWTDAVRFEPSPADSAASTADFWLAANPLPPIAGGGHTGPTDADSDEYRRISEW